MQAEGRKYATTVRAQGRGHLLRPPTPHIFGGLLDCLSKPNVGIGARSSKYFQAMHSAMKQLALSDVMMMVRQCRIVKCYDSTQCRLLLAIDNSMTRDILPSLECEMTLRRALQLSLVELGGRHLMGKAPQGAMEDILQQAIAHD